ncbi:hypothetical protein AgCh_038459 [Apium graveolens]
MEAANQAKIDVLEAKMKGAIGAKEREGLTLQNAAKIDAESKIMSTRRQGEENKGEIRMSEVVNSMKDIMDFCKDQKDGPIDFQASRHDKEAPESKGLFKQRPDGDVVECVLSHLQPAFDHPYSKGRSHCPSGGREVVVDELTLWDKAWLGEAKFGFQKPCINEKLGGLNGGDLRKMDAGWCMSLGLMTWKAKCISLQLAI